MASGFAVMTASRRGTRFALVPRMVEDDPRQLLWCRVGLLIVSLLHWCAISMHVWQSKAALIQVDVLSDLC